MLPGYPAVQTRMGASDFPNRTRHCRGSTQASAQPLAHSAAVVSTPMEAALDALRARFPKLVVIGFEELWDARPDREPQIDLGLPDSSVERVLERIRDLNPAHKVEMLSQNACITLTLKSLARSP